ncbi:EF-hand calcium-binding domain-containing protein 10 [Intoshia linei]|uniref:EF-hand calcium-binding domain-containing protein 10 n=1 Tax=Intoshia linei TaxID=1819745 RepID=A0A177B4V0_9BILA|nr:EF-hand calcium-binding domain-containing protein 10 [Intoshia linei]
MTNSNLMENEATVINDPELHHICQEQKDSVAYIKMHRLDELMNSMMSALIFARPEQPKKYITTYIQNLIENRKNGSEVKGFYNEENIKYLFKMMDPVSTGFITKEQCESAFDMIGQKKYSKTYLKNFSHSRISLETFINYAAKISSDVDQNYMNTNAYKD